MSVCERRILARRPQLLLQTGNRNRTLPSWTGALTWTHTLSCEDKTSEPGGDTCHPVPVLIQMHPPASQEEANSTGKWALCSGSQECRLSCKGKRAEIWNPGKKLVLTSKQNDQSVKNLLKVMSHHLDWFLYFWGGLANVLYITDPPHDGWTGSRTEQSKLFAIDR